jgi:hypothetical protein
MKNPFAIIGGVIGVLVGLAFVMPAVALLRDKGALPTFEVGCLLLGIGLTIGGVTAAIYGAKRVRA